MSKESDTLSVALFTTLKQEILPAVIEDARRRNWTLRFWCAGCRTGEKPYALAMVLADLLGHDIGQFQIKIFATDDDSEALTSARKGSYDSKMLSALPEGYATRFFEQNEQSYRIVRVIRELVIFGMHDLERNPPFSHLDGLLCHYSLSAFTSQQQSLLLSRFAFVLAPRKGYLLLGQKSHVQLSPSLFEEVSLEGSIYRCLGRGEINRLPQEHESYQVRALLEQTIRSQPADELPPTRSSGFRLFSSLGFSDTVVGSAPFGIIVIDQSYRMLHWNRVAEKALALPIIETGQDFFHTVHGLPYAQVRTAIDTVFAEGKSQIVSPVELALSEGGNGHVFSITVTLLPAEVGTVLRIALYFNDITEQTLFNSN